MKLVRYYRENEIRPGIWIQDEPEAPTILDVRSLAFDIADYNATFFQHWGPQRLQGLVSENKLSAIPADEVRLAAPVAPPGKIICLGKNYAEHAREFDARVPTDPIFFSKAPSALIGPQDDIEIPSPPAVIDAEVELAAVIGRVTQGVAPENALACIAGYMIINDVTNRSLQHASLQWFEAKSADTFCPAGPWLVTADEIPDPHNLSLQSHLNGEPLQTGHTKDLIFKLPELVSRLSSRITLMPGDVIATGTPAGIGSAQEPPRILKDGDTMTLSIPGLGQQQNGIKQKKQG